MFNSKRQSNQYRLNGVWMVCKNCGETEFEKKEVTLAHALAAPHVEMLTCVGCGVAVFVNPKYGDLKELTQ